MSPGALGFAGTVVVEVLAGKAVGSSGSGATDRALGMTALVRVGPEAPQPQLVARVRAAEPGESLTIMGTLGPARPLFAAPVTIVSDGRGAAVAPRRGFRQVVALTVSRQLGVGYDLVPVDAVQVAEISIVEDPDVAGQDLAE